MMNYILIYDILNDVSLNPLTIFINTALDISFPFLMLLVIIKNQKRIFKIYLLSTIFFSSIKWIEAINLNSIINEKKYSEVEGKIYNHTPPNRYKRELESFYVKGQKFTSLSSYGFNKDYKVILKNGINVKIDYTKDNKILRFYVYFVK